MALRNPSQQSTLRPSSSFRPKSSISTPFGYLRCMTNVSSTSAPFNWSEILHHPLCLSPSLTLSAFLLAAMPMRRSASSLHFHVAGILRGCFASQLENAWVPPSLDARTVQYFNMANTTREWKPSRLVVRDCQRTIQRAYGDTKGNAIYPYGRYMLKKSRHGFQKIRRELYKY